MSKITEGNWRFSTAFKTVTTSRPGILEGSKCICDLNTNVSHDENQGEVDANGHLISAAPKLLKTLEMFLEEAETQYPTLVASGLDKTLVLAREAINQAKGITNPADEVL
jgi:hypothetical protein